MRKIFGLSGLLAAAFSLVLHQGVAATEVDIGAVTWWLGGTTSGHANGDGQAAKFSFATDAAVNPVTGDLYISEYNNQRVRLVAAGTSTVSDLTTTAEGSLWSIVVTADGIAAYVSSGNQHRIFKIQLSDRSATLFAGGTQGGSEGTGSTVQLNAPGYLAIVGANLYVNERSQRVRVLTIPGAVSSALAGAYNSPGFTDHSSGANVRFSTPVGIAHYAVNNVLVVADANNRRVRTVAIAGGTTTTIAGNAASGNADGSGSAATFTSPSDVVVIDHENYAFLSDSSGRRIRRVDLTSPYAVVTVGNTAGTSGVAGNTVSYLATFGSQTNGLGLDDSGRLIIVGANAISFTTATFVATTTTTTTPVPCEQSNHLDVVQGPSTLSWRGNEELGSMATSHGSRAVPTATLPPDKGGTRRSESIKLTFNHAVPQRNSHLLTKPYHFHISGITSTLPSRPEPDIQHRLGNWTSCRLGNRTSRSPGKPDFTPVWETGHHNCPGYWTSRTRQLVHRQPSAFNAQPGVHLLHNRPKGHNASQPWPP